MTHITQIYQYISWLPRKNAIIRLHRTRKNGNQTYKILCDYQGIYNIHLIVIIRVSCFLMINEKFDNSLETIPEALAVNLNSEENKEIKIKDDSLRLALKQELTKPINLKQMKKLKQLEWNEYQAEAEQTWVPIESLEGMEGAVKVTHLYLDGNHIKNLDPLEGAEKLEEVWLVQNSITDLKGIGGKKKIKTLNLDMNCQLAVISPVEGMERLECLNINSTKVEDLSPLKNLSKLSINYTKVRDLSPLAGLSLKRLTLNFIPADLSPGTKNRAILVGLLKNGTEVFSELIDELKKEACL